MGTTTTVRTARATAAGVGLLLLVTGCTGADPSGDGPSTSPTPTAEGTAGAEPTAPAADEASPVTELGLTCAELLSEETALAADPRFVVRDAYDRPTVLPADYAIAQEGGLACTWNDGTPTDGKNNAVGGGEFAGLRVEVLPHAADDWPRFVEIYGEDAAENCFVAEALEGAVTGCTSDQLVGDTWVSLSMRGFALPEGGTPEEVLAPVLAEVVGAVEGATITDEAWPLGGPAPAWSCVADAQLEQATVPGADTATLQVPGGGWSLYASAWARATATLCSATPGGGAPATTESVLTGGAWGLRQRLEFGHVPADSAVDVEGLPEGAAYRNCDDAGCTTDLVLGDDWARLVVHRDLVPDAEAASEAYADAYAARALGTR